jgi:Chaperone of endosialidase
MSWYNPLSWGGGSKVHLSPNAGKLPGADELRRLGREGFQGAGGREAPMAQRTMVAPVRTGQAAQLSPGANAQSRDLQLQLANRLLGISSGQEMGAGEMAAMRQGNQAIAQQQAMARMGRGANAPLAARAAATNTANIGLNTAGQAQQAALQDQQVASGQLAGVAGQMRGQDIDVAGQNAQLRQGMNLANLSAENQRIFQQAGLDQATSLADQQAKLAQTGMNDQAQIAFLSQMYNVSTAQMQGLLERQRLRIANQGTPIAPAIIGGAAQVGAAYAMSDRTLKKDVRRVSRQIDEMLDKLVPQSYRYKDEGAHGQGRRAGIMAQDLEVSEAGRRIVRETPDGKAIDVSAGISAALAAVARLNERVREVEKKGK